MHTDAPPNARVLVVEDDRKLAAQICAYLEQNFMSADAVHDGVTAAARIAADPPEVVVLDLMLPRLDGIAVLRRIRSAFPGRVLMLTASHSESDHVAGLEVGADDFVTKPVVPRILLARIRALLRRDHARARDEQDEPLLRGQLGIDPATREVTWCGALVPLTAAEFDVVRLLAHRSGEVLGREALCRQIRGIAYDGIDRTIDIHIARIRRKLESAGAPKSLIKSVRGEGYVMAVRR